MTSSFYTKRTNGFVYVRFEIWYGYVNVIGGLTLEKKVVFFDIDGTLYDTNKELPDSARHAVNQLKERGHEVVIATGRAPFTFANLCEDLAIDSFISINGQYVVHNGENIFTNPLEDESLHKLIEAAGERKHELLFVNETGWRSNGKFSERLEKAIGSLKVDHAIEYESEPFAKGTNLQSLIFCERGEEDYYMEAFPMFQLIRWHDSSLDIIPKGGSKARGIQAYLDAVGIPLENAYAFGDGLNDMEMMEYVPNSVAMGNAFAEVKQAARHTTDHVDEDGIYNGLKRLGLID